MKKRIILVLALVSAFAIVFSGCGKSKHYAVVSLESNPSTGYSWTYKACDNVTIEDEYIEPETKEAVGVPGTQVFTIRLKEKGDGKVTFTYERESTGEKARTLTYWFTADEKGNVTFDKSSGKDLEHKGKVLQAPEPEIF